jgi:hypothetical protein
MQLDIARRGLKRGFLVNGGGQVCWKDREGHFTCGVMYSADMLNCGDNNKYCRFCRNTQITQERY